MFGETDAWVEDVIDAVAAKDDPAKEDVERLNIIHQYLRDNDKSAVVPRVAGIQVTNLLSLYVAVAGKKSVVATGYVV